MSYSIFVTLPEQYNGADPKEVAVSIQKEIYDEGDVAGLFEIHQFGDGLVVEFIREEGEDYSVIFPDGLDYNSILTEEEVVTQLALEIHPHAGTSKVANALRRSLWFSKGRGWMVSGLSMTCSGPERIERRRTALFNTLNFLMRNTQFANIAKAGAILSTEHLSTRPDFAELINQAVDILVSGVPDHVLTEQRTLIV